MSKLSKRSQDIINSFVDRKKFRDEEEVVETALELLLETQLRIEADYAFEGLADLMLEVRAMVARDIARVRKIAKKVTNG